MESRLWPGPAPAAAGIWRMKQRMGERSLPLPTSLPPPVFKHKKFCDTELGRQCCGTEREDADTLWRWPAVTGQGAPALLWEGTDANLTN